MPFQPSFTLTFYMVIAGSRVNTRGAAVLFLRKRQERKKGSRVLSGGLPGRSQPAAPLRDALHRPVSGAGGTEVLKLQPPDTTIESKPVTPVVIRRHTSMLEPQPASRIFCQNVRWPRCVEGFRPGIEERG